MKLGDGMKLETYDEDDLRRLYARKCGRPCVFVDFHDDLVIPTLRAEVAFLFHALSPEALEGALEQAWCVVSFGDERDAILWSAKIVNDGKNLPLNIVLYAADGVKLLDNYS
jgi:hypothetical protein